MSHNPQADPNLDSIVTKIRPFEADVKDFARFVKAWRRWKELLVSNGNPVNLADLSSDVGQSAREIREILEETRLSTARLLGRLGLSDDLLLRWVQSQRRSNQQLEDWLAMDILIEQAHVRIDLELERLQIEAEALPSGVRVVAENECEGEGTAGNTEPPRDSAESSGMGWEEAVERLKNLLLTGTAWTSQQQMADQIGCAPSTINKAIRKTPELQNWAKRQAIPAPRAQSLTPPQKGGGAYLDMITDRKAQSRELDPEDEVAIREYLEREDLKPEERAFFNGLSPEDQLAFLDDPDKHQKILGRKP
jgi:hypothetical protein